MIYKSLSIVVALTLSASASAQSQFEEWLLHRHKHWEVLYYEENGNVGCAAENAVDEMGISFYITYDRHGLDINLYDRNRNWSRASDSVIRAWIDRRKPWRVLANAEGTTIWGDLTNKNFLLEVVQGNEIYFDVEGNDDWDYRFSLAGSAAAIAALNSCVEKL